MTERTWLPGIDGANPLGFLASLGLLRLVHAQTAGARLGYASDGSNRAFVECGQLDLVELVADDASTRGGKQPWSLEYAKEEKRGVKTVADLKAPPEVFAAFASACVERWVRGEAEGAAYAAAFATTVARDGKGNVKPTALHFTAANQQFLGTVESIRASVTAEWVSRSLFHGNAAAPGSNLRWDPSAERNWALMASNPIDEGTKVDAPLEWLAFRGLPLLPTFPVGSRVVTATIEGRGDDMRMSWPLWSVPASLATVASLLRLRWAGATPEHVVRGVFAVCSSSIRRTGQGFGSFGPSMVGT